MIVANPFSMQGKRVLVTGASSGIGQCTAVSLSQMGATLIISGRNKERLEETLGMLAGEGHEMILADYLGADPVNDIVTNLKSPINGLVHSAGISKAIPFSFSNQAALREMMQINFELPFLITQQIVKKKLIVNGGSILFISSLFGGSDCGGPGMSIYSASKAALIGAMKSMALDLVAKKIRVNCVSPGMVKTNLITKFDNITPEDFKKHEMEKYPLGYGEAVDVANAIIYFLSDASKWITGANLVMDGGASIL